VTPCAVGWRCCDAPAAGGPQWASAGWCPPQGLRRRGHQRHPSRCGGVARLRHAAQPSACYCRDGAPGRSSSDATFLSARMPEFAVPCFEVWPCALAASCPQRFGETAPVTFPSCAYVWTADVSL